MELVTEPDTYMPSMDNSGNYIDNIPQIKNGIRCPCGTRKDKSYDSHNVFASHIKTKTHQKWLSNINLNKANYYIENENLKNTLQNQRIIIAQMDKEIQNKNLTIDYLTQQLISKNDNNSYTVTNLLCFD